MYNIMNKRERYIHTVLDIHTLGVQAAVQTNNLFGMHEMHGQMHPNYCQITILLVVDLCSLLAYFYDDPTSSHSQQIAYKNFGC